MRLGGRIFYKWDSPEGWIKEVQAFGYTTAHCPVYPSDDDATIDAYLQAAEEADITIAEVGVWNNMISPDEEARKKNLEKNVSMLALADRVGARCCVNIVGSRDPEDWHGPHPDNVTDATYDLIVQTIQGVIDAVNPTKTFFTLEMMGWAIPDSADQYLQLIKDIDRPGFAVHLDPVNLINSPRRFYQNGEVLKETITKLAPHIRSVHAKDVTLGAGHLVHLDECPPGTGSLDYDTFFTEISKLDDDMPIILEHLPNEEEYRKAIAFVRGKAQELGVKL